jgi:hypothetical protein
MRKTFFFRFCFKVVLLSHIPFPLPGFEIEQVTRGEDSLIITAVATALFTKIELL